MKCVANDEGCLGEATNPENPVCTSCAAKGWTANFKEMSELVANDPELGGKIQIASPLQPPPQAEE
jgi:hypothetical protein